jgi:hypothetical protein
MKNVFSKQNALIFSQQTFSSSSSTTKWLRFLSCFRFNCKIFHSPHQNTFDQPTVQHQSLETDNLSPIFNPSPITAVNLPCPFFQLLPLHRDHRVFRRCVSCYRE